MSKVLVIACGALAHDLVAVRELNQWRHIEFKCLPAELHNYPAKIPQAVRQKIHENKQQYDDIFVAYSDCGTGGQLDRLLEEEGVKRLYGAHCYEMFSGTETFQKMTGAEIATFYLTDFLALHFDRLIVRGLGMDRFPELKHQYFHHYKKLIYLAQTDNEDINQKARQAAEFLGLDYQRVFTGHDHLQSELKVQIGSIRRKQPEHETNN